MTPIIRRFVIKLLSKDQGSGITKLPGQMQAGFQESMVTEKLVRNGYDPRIIKSETELKMILNRIDASKKQSKEQKDKAMKQLATIMDMKGRKIKPGAKIMGGEEVVETEAEILERLNRSNKESALRMRNKKMIEDAVDNASPGFVKGDRKYNAQLVAEDLAEKRFGKEFYDLSQEQQIDLYGEALEGLSKPKFRLNTERFQKDFNVSDEEMEKILALSPEEQQKILREYIDKDFKQQIELSDFDVTDKEPNAQGGIVGLRI